MLFNLENIGVIGVSYIIIWLLIFEKNEYSIVAENLNYVLIYLITTAVYKELHLNLLYFKIYLLLISASFDL